MMALVCRGVAQQPAAKNKDAAKISDVIKEIVALVPDCVVGYEVDNECKRSIADFPAVKSALMKADWQRLKALISAETDYECLVGDGFFVFVPKGTHPVFGVPIAKRMVAYPEATNLEDYKFLSTIKSVNEKAPVALSGYPVFVNGEASGKITIKANQDVCYSVLNEMARQLKARCWAMTYHLWNNTVTGKKIPRRDGEIIFYSPPNVSID
jgi:hypothetical protein